MGPMECKSPVVVDLSSDSEREADGNSPPPRSTQSTEEVFTLDWADNDYPTSAHDILDLYNELDINQQQNSSISSADTEIYTPDIDEQITWDESPAKQSSSQVLSKTDKVTQKESEKLKKEQSKLEKKRLKAEKKAEELKQKRLRAAAVQKQRNLKPEENIKLLSINIDTKVVNSEFGGVLITSLQQAGIQYNVGNQIKPFTISWSKKEVDIIVSDEGVTQEDVGVKEENQLLYIIDANEIVKLVNSNELLTHVQIIKSVYCDKSLTLVITGMQRYFHMQKKKLSENSMEQTGKKRRHKGSGASQFLYVSKDEIEIALIELQIIGHSNHCMIETGEELASLIVSTTKSLSQLDYKREKYKREEGQLDWFAKGDSKQCVKVDKNGAGLTKLWQQQICQFNAVGLEIASAIISNYPSPQNLINSYKKCKTTSEAELLLQNIQMRREAGILSSARRIGPEISKKIYHFYMSDDPVLEL